MSDGETALNPKDGPARRFVEQARRIGISGGEWWVVLGGAIRHFAAAPADAAVGAWVPLGPRNVGGAIRCLAQDPVAPDVWYAGSSQGGLWRTVDDGYSWRSVLDAVAPLVPPGLPVGAVAVDRNAHDTVYFGTGEPFFAHLGGAGIFQYDVPTGNVTELASELALLGGAGHYTRIVMDPRTAGRLWVASDTGLWRREPGGAFTREPLTGVAAASRVTDVAVAEDPGNPNVVVLLAGVYQQGVFRGRFDRTSVAAGTAWTAVVGLPPGAGLGRVRLAFSGLRAGVTTRPWAYAVFQENSTTTVSNGGFSKVYRSTDFGVTFVDRPGAQKPGGGTGQPFYALSLTVDPADPRRVVVGAVDLFMSVDAGLTWTRVLDWTRYDQGDRAQHADQHEAVFDVRDSRRIWVGNDGGVSMTPDLGITWRKKSYGLSAAQLTDITTHPKHPFIYGGGMQDNGTFVSFGGATWYRLMGGDGGQMAFHPTNPRVFWAAWQGSEDEHNPIYRVELRRGAFAENSAYLPDRAPPDNIIVPHAENPMRFPGENDPVFVPILEADPDPARPDELFIGRKKGGFYTRDGRTVAALTLPGVPHTPGPGRAPEEISTFTLAEGVRDYWAGTSFGNVYLLTGTRPTPPPGFGPPWRQALPTTVAPVIAAPGHIYSITVHRANPNVVAVASIMGNVLLSHDKGTTWVEIGATPVQRLPQGPVLSLAFHPTDTTVLFAGTLVGVYVARNLPARPAGTAALAPPVPVSWATFGAGMPNVQVNDLHVTPFTNTLRAGTFGRGVYERDLHDLGGPLGAGVTRAGFEIPDVFLYIREHVTDDGRPYPDDRRVFSDPRVPAPAVEPTDNDRQAALDIRGDAPDFNPPDAAWFGADLDAAEFDERLVSDDLVIGDINHLYVQVHHRGKQRALGTQLHVYFARVRPDGVVPPIDNASLNFPGVPTAASDWQLLGAVAPAIVPATFDIDPGQPRVLRVPWVPPLAPARKVAVLAIASHGSDMPAIPPLPTEINVFLRGERRAAMRVFDVKRDVLFIRDGVDDAGLRGAVAWGARSPDLVVVPAAIAAPDDPVGVLSDLSDPRHEDRARVGDNVVHVRVSNRARLPVDARVRLFRVPLGSLTPASGWAAIGADVDIAAISARGWKFATFNWTGVTDPAPEKAFALLAVASARVGGVEIEEFPDPASFDSVAAFWREITGGDRSSRAALRLVRMPAAPIP